MTRNGGKKGEKVLVRSHIVLNVSAGREDSRDKRFSEMNFLVPGEVHTQCHLASLGKHSELCLVRLLF